MINFKRFWLDWAMAFVPTALVLPISVPAMLKSKAIRNYMVPRSPNIGTAFELTFELENKGIKRFNVTADQFSLVFENNRGILTYKEHSKSRFVDFDVQEING